MASTIVSRTQSGAESAAGRRTWTFSCWFKRSKLGNFELFGSDSDGARNNNFFIIDFRSTDEIDMAEYISGYQLRFITNRKFRDTSAWYHLVVAFDTTQSTASDRVKIYVNGVQETSFSTATYPSQDYQTKMFASNKIHAFGRSGYQINGILSHCHATEGTAYTPSAFGETDATTGEWKIKTSPSVSYGTNGFFLFKNDNSVTNQAGNSSGNFAVTAGTLTKTEDCPSNVFPTINPLTYSTTKWNLEYGNLRTNGLASGESQGYRSVYGTLGASSGKYYFEMKVTRTYSSDPNFIFVGIVDAEQMEYAGDNGNFINKSRGYGYKGADGTKENAGVGASYGATYTTNDIIGCAFDLDNHKIYWSKNGVWQNSGDPTSGSTGTGSAYDLATGYTYLPAVSHYYDDDRIELNFGNGYFGITAVSSAGTNASGNGIFEYDVPTGYTALSTKGLNL